MHLYTQALRAIAVFTIASSAALAGPEVSVTFRNLGDSPALYLPQGSNQFATRNNASPAPVEEIPKNGSDRYNVRSQVSPLVNYANVRYVMGNKACVFLTTFVATYGFAGTKIPKWNHSATPSGGATCNIRSTGVNLSDYSWSVEMTMR